MEDMGINNKFVYPDCTFWKNKKVLVTGHTGFKGCWLTLWLKKLGANVSGISLKPSTKINLFDQLNHKKKINHIIEDINSIENIEKHIKNIRPEVVFHLAAQPLVLDSFKYPVETWKTNVIGTINVLSALLKLDDKCVMIAVTTDKVYKNQDLKYAFREDDPLGGNDPYSSSKAACELALNAWKMSFCGNKNNQKDNLFIASARAGNVIGGGDWSENRIIPDIVKSLSKKKIIKIRNPKAVRPWQHVLEPICGYLLLAEYISINECNEDNIFNFGPLLNSNKTVENLVEESLLHWKGRWENIQDNESLLEAHDLRLAIDKSQRVLNWIPRWSFEETVYKTIMWYKKYQVNNKDVMNYCLDDINAYLN